jgi:hypothetical protein
MEKNMPQYTIKKRTTEEEWDVVCSWNELQEILKEDDDLIQKPSAPKIVSHTGMMLSKTSDGWKDVLKKIKKGSGKGNTINT